MASFNPPVAPKKTAAAISDSVAGSCPTTTRSSAKPCRTCCRSRSSCCWGVVPTTSSRRIGRVGADSPGHAIADRFNSVPKHVATHRSDTLDWQNSYALKCDLADAIRALKHQDGAKLLTWGSGDMVRQLL